MFLLTKWSRLSARSLHKRNRVIIGQSGLAWRSYEIFNVSHLNRFCVPETFGESKPLVIRDHLNICSLWRLKACSAKWVISKVLCIKCLRKQIRKFSLWALLLCSAHWVAVSVLSYEYLVSMESFSFYFTVPGLFWTQNRRNI